MGQFWIKTQIEITEYKGLDVPCFLLRELSMTRLACAMEDYTTSSVVGAGCLVFGFWSRGPIHKLNLNYDFKTVFIFAIAMSCQFFKRFFLMDPYF